MTPLCAAGSAIAIGGSYLYASAKTAEKLAAERAAAKGKEGVVADAAAAPPGKDRGKHPLLPLIKALGSTGLS